MIGLILFHFLYFSRETQRQKIKSEAVKHSGPRHRRMRHGFLN